MCSLHALDNIRSRDVPSAVVMESRGVLGGRVTSECPLNYEDDMARLTSTQGHDDREIPALLQTISEQLEEIRQGKANPPAGANPSPRRVIPTTEDLFTLLESVVGLLERQNIILYNLGKITVELSEGADDKYWDQLMARD